MRLLEECVISLVLSHHSKDLQLSNSSVLFGKQRVVHPRDVRAANPKRRTLDLSWLPPFTHLSLPHGACSMQIGLAKKGVYLLHLKFSHQSAGFLFHFFRLSPFFVFQSLPYWTYWTYFSCSSYLIFPPQEMGGKIIGEQGHQGLSGYLLLSWDGGDHWASPSCQSQASESLYWCPAKGE